MNSVPGHILKFLKSRENRGISRNLRISQVETDFSSNDYLGLARIKDQASADQLKGSSGSRLLTGNHPVHESFEQFAADFFQAESALLFSSGYMANFGLIASLPSENALVIYDAWVHASIRDGLGLTRAQTMPFAHNDLVELAQLLKAGKARLAQKVNQETDAEGGNREIYVVTESIFSMDGDRCPLPELVCLCEKYGAYLILDEAHSTGILGFKGEGLAVSLGLQDRIFARIHTFGKGMGRQGAIIAGPLLLKHYLINRCRSFIFSTAPSPAEVSGLMEALQLCREMQTERENLETLQGYFKDRALSILGEIHEADQFLSKIQLSESPIFPVIVPGNERIKTIAGELQAAGLDVRPILSPTVEKGTERLRIILHAFNTKAEIDLLINQLVNSLAKN